MRTDVKIIGDRKLRAFFRTLPGKLQRGGVRKAVRAGGSAYIKLLRNNIKAMVSSSASSNARRASKRRNASGKTTSLAQSIAQRLWSVPHKGLIASIAGAKWPDGAHSHLVEYGHEIVTHSGRSTGKRARPVPFTRRTNEESRGPVLAAQARKMRDVIANLRGF